MGSINGDREAKKLLRSPLFKSPQKIRRSVSYRPAQCNPPNANQIDHEAGFISLFQMGMDPAFILDAHGIILAINPAARDQWASANDDHLGHSVTEMIPEIDIDELKQLFVDHAQAKFFAGVVRKDGSRASFTVSMEESIYRGEKCLIGIAREVNVQDLPAMHQNQTENYFRDLIDLAKESFTVIDPTGKILFANLAAARFFNKSTEAMLNVHLGDLFSEDERSQRMAVVMQVIQTGKSQYAEFTSMRNQSLVYNYIAVHPIKDGSGRVTAALVVGFDITNLKSSEKALQQSEAKFSKVFNYSPVAISLTRLSDGLFIDVNESFARLTGHTRAEMIGHTAKEMHLYPNIETRDRLMCAVNNRGSLHNIDLNLQQKPHREYDALASLDKIVVDDQECVLIMATDISERIKMDSALRHSEQRFKRAFDTIPDIVSIYDHDLRVQYLNRAATQFIDGLSTQSTDLRFAEPSHKPGSEWIGRHGTEVWSPEIFSLFSSTISEAFTTKSICLIETDVRQPNGVTRSVYFTSIPVIDELGEVVEVVAITHDVTEKKESERIIHENEAKFRSYIEHAPVAVIVTNVNGDLVEFNRAAEELVGYSAAYLISHKFRKLIFPDDMGLANRCFETLSRQTYAEGQYRLRKRNGEPVWISVRAVLLNKDRIISFFSDISEHKLTEKTLREQVKLQEKLSKIAAAVPGVLISYQMNPDGTQCIPYCSQAAESILGIKPEDVRDDANPFYTHLPPESARRLSAEIANSAENLRPIDMEGPFHSLARGDIWIEARTTPTRQPDGTVIWDGYIQDITDRKNAEKQIRRQFKRLSALHNIDLAITGEFNLDQTLNLILQHVISQLNVDAACIMLLNSQNQMLEYGASQGFTSDVIRSTRLRPCEIYIGDAGTEPQQMLAGDPSQTTEQLRLILCSEDVPFVTYYGEPLLSKGKVIGVLQVFGRKNFYPDAEWLDYLQSLATQSAIAIDNSQLLTGLQLSNNELNKAYETTLEGWSCALDLRDKETEGHTRRVTDMTLLLAEKLGIDQEEMIHIRRGALLHDIGKMGVPDAILFKADKLTEEEWRIMRKHPDYAYQMLAPIEYLRSALIIPYCHHEKWDGTGYPRGLKGEEIPLPARIFSVIDVFDALTSDRPYRAAWSAQKACEYIISSAGTFFDPDIVKAFIELDLPKLLHK